jgi:two-component system CheB/CheR fusion protein
VTGVKRASPSGCGTVRKRRPNLAREEALAKSRALAASEASILNSSDIATVLLDRTLKVRFLSRAARLLFGARPGEKHAAGTIADRFRDERVLEDARLVLSTHAPVTREIQSESGAWHAWRLSPCWSRNNHISGVVISVTDVTAYIRAREELNAARLHAESVSLGKSRYLAAASHDLRQPLHTLGLVHGMMVRKLADPSGLRQLLARAEDSLSAMSGMLDTLLDINQLESGVLHPRLGDFPIGHLLQRMKSEFAYPMQSRGLEWRVLPCRLAVRSDPRLLEQMIRNLLANAAKYTKKGRILLGCRRHAERLRIEVWDTGPGIPHHKLRAIFEESYQQDNPAHDLRYGAGLGLAIVQHLGQLLSHRVDVRSREAHGSVFSVEVGLAPVAADVTASSSMPAQGPEAPAVRRGSLLIVEDDPTSREALELLLRSEGHRTIAASDAEEAIALAARPEVRPDAVIVDYDLPRALTGLDVTTRLREAVGHDLPTLVLTGDISTQTSQEIAARGYLQGSKPVLPERLTHLVQSLLAKAP